MNVPIARNKRFIHEILLRALCASLRHRALVLDTIYPTVVICTVAKDLQLPFPKKKSYYGLCIIHQYSQ